MPAISVRCSQSAVVNDARHGVALAGHDVAGAAAVPGGAVVEDVAESVPLGGDL